MSVQYFEHQILLVQGISILNSYSIIEEKIIEAGRVLKGYVRGFEILYGKKHLSCNLHLLLHLPDNVRKFGPLWTTSCFAFENLNGVLKSYVHGTRYAELQICSSVSTFLSLTELKEQLFSIQVRKSDFILVWTFAPDEARVKRPHEDKITFSLAYRTQFFRVQSLIQRTLFYSSVRKVTLCARSVKKVIETWSDAFHFCKRMQFSGTHSKKITRLSNSIFAIGAIKKNY